MAAQARVGETTYTTPSDRELVTTRAFDAPRDLVWEAWTSPEHLPNWLLGPEGWTMPVCESDLRVGGAWHFVWQSDADVGPSRFGDGLGCLGGTLKRLYTRSAAGGVVAAPQLGDPSISARSAARGDPIAPGEARIYHAFYRDPDPSFCPMPSGSTFNTTNALRVRWGN